MCGLIPGSCGDASGKPVVAVWKSLGFFEPIDDIQGKFREVWNAPYVPLPDDRQWMWKA